MAGNCLFDPFLLNYIHICTYFVKKRDSYQIFRLSMKILWEPGSQVPRHYPTLAATEAQFVTAKAYSAVHDTESNVAKQAAKFPGSNFTW